MEERPPIAVYKDDEVYVLAYAKANRYTSSYDVPVRGPLSAIKSMDVIGISIDRSKSKELLQSNSLKVPIVNNSASN